VIDVPVTDLLALESPSQRRGEIVAIEQPILRRDRHELLAAHRLDQDRRVGDVESCQSLSTTAKWFL
jgi:hypothetical protein